MHTRREGGKCVRGQAKTVRNGHKAKTKINSKSTTTTTTTPTKQKNVQQEGTKLTSPKAQKNSTPTAINPPKRAETARRKTPQPHKNKPTKHVNQANKPNKQTTCKPNKRS